MSQSINDRALLVFSVLLFVMCSQCKNQVLEAQVPLPQDVWIWRRQWTPALSSSLRALPTRVNRVRVLVMERESTPGRSQRVEVDLAALRAAGRPVWMTWRVDGAVPLTEAEFHDDLAVLISLAHHWRSQGIEVLGLEVDHDCATSRLASYGVFLHQVRAQLPPSLRLAVTALPTWKSVPRILQAALKDVDEVTVQLHAVAAPSLFEPRTAAETATAFVNAAGRPVGVALPTYEARLRTGTLLRPQAHDVIEVARALRHTPGISHVAYFRLGAEDDEAAFPHATLTGILEGRDVKSEMVLQAKLTAPNLIDVFVENRGDGPGDCAPRILFREFGATRVRAAEGAPGVEVDGDAFVLQETWLPAAAHRRLGWLRLEGS